MRQRVTSFLFIFLLFPFFLTKAHGAPSTDVVVNEVLIKFKPGLSSSLKDTIISGVETDLGGMIRQEADREIDAQLSKIGVMRLSVPAGKAHVVAAGLRRNKQVIFAEPNAIAQKMGVANDPSLSKQWGLAKIQATSDSVESAWDVVKGSANIRVAVLDTGISKNHPDLVGRVILEKDFTNGVSGPIDNDGHGTHVAGSIGAISDNAVGIASVGYSASLLNGKVLGDNGYGTYSGIASGIVWAADNGAHVINLSLGGSSDSQTLKSAVDYAASKGAVMVAAAGNSGSQTPLYPAFYDSVLSVAAIDQNDMKPSWSNYGTWIDVAAPGVSIYSTFKNNDYANYSGTSMATSYVSGAAILAWSTGKCATESCVDDLLQSSADKISGTGSQWKHGRINVYTAVKSQTTVSPTPTIVPSPSPTPTPTATPTIEPTPTGDEVTPTVTPQVTPTLTPSPTSIPTNTPTLTPTPQNLAMTASNIEMWVVKRGFYSDIYTRVTVVDKNTTNPLSSASISVRLGVPAGFSYTGSGSTNSQGQVTFILRGQFQKGNYTSTITNVTKSGYQYSPSQTTKTLMVQ